MKTVEKEKQKSGLNKERGHVVINSNMPWLHYQVKGSRNAPYASQALEIITHRSISDPILLGT